MDQAESLRKIVVNASFQPDVLRAERHAKTVAVISGKGGVGKSNFVLNFALNLTRTHGDNVLLIDCDIGMGNIDLLLGQPYEKKSIVDLLKRRDKIENVIKNGPLSLHYLSGGISLSEVVTVDEEEFRFFLNELERMVEKYDVIFFDMGAGISNESLKFLLAVDEIIVITTPEPTSIMDAYSAIKLVHQFNKEKNIKLVVNRYQKKREVEETYEKIKNTSERFLQKAIELLGCLPEDDHVKKAVMEQIPFILRYPNAPVSKAINSATNIFLNGTMKKRSFIDSLRSLFLK